MQIKKTSKYRFKEATMKRADESNEGYFRHINRPASFIKIILEKQVI